MVWDEFIQLLWPEGLEEADWLWHVDDIQHLKVRQEV